MLLFVYVLGGAIQTGGDNYVNYQLPGILLITIASDISYTAYRLFTDKQRGIFERFHSMPIARSAPLWGHVLTSLVSTTVTVIVVVLVTILLGFRSSAGVLSWLAIAGILALFTLSLTWVAVIAGLAAKTPICFISGESSGLMPEELSYVTTKGALETFTRTLAVAVSGKGITVNAINPGPADTGWMDAALYTMLLERFPSGRVGLPEDAARLAAFLAGDASKWITAQIIHSEGGSIR